MSAEVQSKPWVLRQTWLDLAFLHYKVDAQELRRVVPEWLDVDTFDGDAWIGIVPFRMYDVMIGKLPMVPILSTFPELNVRTYVTYRGEPGVWFFSLDATRWLAVKVARILTGLPYHHANMTHDCTTSGVHFTSSRKSSGVGVRGWYKAVGEVRLATPGSFEYWSTERYRLYAVRKHRRLSIDVQHPHWPLQNCEFDMTVHRALVPQAMNIDMTSPRALYSAGVKVLTSAPVYHDIQ